MSLVQDFPPRSASHHAFGAEKHAISRRTGWDLSPIMPKMKPRPPPHHYVERIANRGFAAAVWPQQPNSSAGRTSTKPRFRQPSHSCAPHRARQSPQNLRIPLEDVTHYGDGRHVGVKHHFTTKHGAVLGNGTSCASTQAPHLTDVPTFRMRRHRVNHYAVVRSDDAADPAW